MKSKADEADLESMRREFEETFAFLADSLPSGISEGVEKLLQLIATFEGSRSCCCSHLTRIYCTR